MLICCMREKARFGVRLLAFFALGVPIAAIAQSVPGCGSLQNSFGPFDYRDPVARGKPLSLVESAHFTPQVEALTKGNTGYLMGDIDYTLRAFPNHHRALNSVARYALRGGQDWRNPQIPSADCYFERAIAFRSDDETVRMIYGNYLAKRGNRHGAERQYEEALRLAPNDAEVNYNAGLLYVQFGDVQRAKRHADIAYAGGYPLPGLRNKIAEIEKRSTR